MNALRAFVAGLFDAILKWAQGQKDKPKEIKHAEVDEVVAKEWQEFLERNDAGSAPDRMRKPTDSGH